MIWNSEDVLSIVEELRRHGDDFTSVEVKKGTGGCPDVAETLCAFGNMPDGGLLLIGIDEQHNFDPIGVPDPATIEKGIASQARNSVSPPVAVAFDTVDVAGNNIVVATVAGLPANARPCRTGGKAYLRQADGDYVMSAQEEQQLLAARDRPRYDATPVDETSRSDLDENLVATLIRNVRSVSRRMTGVDDQTVLRRKGVIEPEGTRLTLGGLYALGAYPQQFAPNLSVTAAVVTSPGSADRLIDLVHLDGPLPDLLESTMEWLRRNLRTGIRVGADGHNYDHYEFPLGALRELVANALVHRDLGPNTQSKRVEIRLRPDRLVISNPGGLWGVSRQQLGMPGGKSAVNEYLYDLCTLINTAQGSRIIEGEGGGIGEAQRELADWGAEPPIFVDTGVSFTAILMRKASKRTTAMSSKTLLSSTEQQVIATLSNGPLDRNAISDRAGLTTSQTRYALKKLVKSGIVIMQGGLGSRNTTYTIAE
jgi:ATP-dependent DNA helicase RecG